MRFNADLLRRLRNDMGLSQEALALLAGIERESLSRYETGARQPTGSALVEICRVLSLVAARAGHMPIEPQQMYVRDERHVGAVDSIDGWDVATLRGK